MAMAACMLVSTADAAARLTGSTPRADAVVKESPASIRIQFNEVLQAAGASGVLKNEAGEVRETGRVSSNAGNPRQLIVPVTGELAPGKYSFAWRVIGRDGPTNGTLAFEVQP